MFIVSRIGKLSSLNKSLSLELETPTAYFDEESLGKIYIKVKNFNLPFLKNLKC